MQAVIIKDMQPGINSSFIPKKDIKRRQKKGSSFGANVFLLIGVVIFMATLLAALGVYLYDKKLGSDNIRKLTQIQESQDDLGVNTFRSDINLSNRIAAAEELLVNHINVTPVFDQLEQSTLTEVYLSDFVFVTEGDTVLVNAQGTAPTYGHVALQAKEYGGERNSAGERQGGNNFLSEVLLSNVNQAREGGINFDLSFEVNRNNLLIQ